MSSEHDIYVLEKSINIIHDTVLTNCIKMVYNRKLIDIDQDSLQNYIDNILSKKSDDLVYELGVYQDQKIMCKIIPFSIIAVEKSYKLVDFLKENKKNIKIIIVKDIHTRVTKYVYENNKNVDIFLEKELMINLIDHSLVPKHILLTQEQANLVLETYLLKKRQIPKILASDPVSRYYGVSPGDMFKIIRPSDKSGASVYYRLVVKG
jgi:DNA-directed RNA polymerase I, II, and III subunit RPABC1